MSEEELETTSAEGNGETDETEDESETIQVWLVERGYTNRDLITLVYATPNGERALQKERAATTMGGSEVTAARDVNPERLSPVTEEETAERYRQEVARTRDRYAPDEPI